MLVIGPTIRCQSSVLVARVLLIGPAIRCQSSLLAGTCDVGNWANNQMPVLCNSGTYTCVVNWANNQMPVLCISGTSDVGNRAID